MAFGRRQGWHTPGFAAALAAASAASALSCSVFESSSAQSKSRDVFADYELGEDLGQGAYAVVKRGKCRRTGKTVAIKLIPKTRSNAETIRQEVATLQRVSLHTNIASLESFYEDEHSFYIVMEYVSGGDLLDAVIQKGSFSERMAMSLISDLAGALALLHAQGVCHGDIKPENLLLDSDGRLKLVDFGLSCEVAEGKRSKSVGTVAYWAPEILTGTEDAAVGLPRDLWALGMVAFVMLAGFHPFDPEGINSESVIRRQIARYAQRNVPFEKYISGIVTDEDGVYSSASKEAKQLINALLRSDPEQRLTVEQLLQHPALREDDVKQSSPGSKALQQKLAEFRLHTAKLRAATFAVLLQQQAIARAAESESSSRQRRESVRERLQKADTYRANMIDTDVLSKAFRTFDVDGKGYISQADMRRVLAELGHADATDGETKEWIAGAAGHDREGQRVAYGSFVRMMNHTVRKAHHEGDFIFRAGDPVENFYCLLEGEVEILRTAPDGSYEVVHQLHAGESFGENSLLSGRATRRHSIRCKTPVEVLQLSKGDFDAVFAHAPPTMRKLSRSEKALARTRSNNHWWLSEEEDALRQRLLGFLQMTSPSTRETLRRGDHVFEDGSAVEGFYILQRGHLVVDAPGATGPKGKSRGRRLGEIHAGEAFGEGSLLEGKALRTKTVTCDSKECEFVRICSRDFMRLVEKSTVVRESFQKLHERRCLLNEYEEDPVIRKYDHR